MFRNIILLPILFILLMLCRSAFSEQYDNCVSCHSQAVSSWQTSDHAKAMSVATVNNVLGDFNNVIFEHYSQTAIFKMKEDKFFIEMEENGDVTEYQVDYTFGHYPLQQYLIEIKPGAFQVFPFAWDSRSKSKGGQRWYPIYEEQDVKENDRLHWKQPLQNWNGMCADCHSSNLKREYNVEKNQFKTTFEEINVGCKSCHIIASSHVTEKADDHRPLIDKNLVKDIGSWLRQKDESVASWQGPARNNDYMDSCFACHSLRSPITDGFRTDIAFLDQFSPSFLSQPLYHADGQIKDEVYVYGSFLQSKMYAAGVTCLDCHDPHTAKVKTQNNGLCLQCHSPQEYQSSVHTGHELSSTGSQCVNCHMPENTYMGVDDRRDHSFKIPRPHLSIQYDTPNACQQCHENKSNQWAMDSLEKLHGEPQVLSAGEHLFIQLLAQYYLPLAQHLQVINDQELNEIKRASAVMLLPNSTRELPLSVAKSLATSDDNLIRLAFTQIAYILPPEQRKTIISPLLDDEFRAIRVAAANQLIGLSIDTLSFNSAFSELLTANEVNMWRGEGNLNQSLVHANMQNWDEAVNALSKGINVDPYFAPNYINLSDYYKNIGEVDKEKSTLLSGIEANPDSSILRYSYAMFQIRRQEKEQALKSMSKAVKLEQANPQFAYIYILLIDDVETTEKAISELQKIINRYDNRRQLIELGLQLSRKVADSKSAKLFQNML